MDKKLFLNLMTVTLFTGAVLVAPALLLFDIVDIFSFSLIELGLVTASFSVDSLSRFLMARLQRDRGQVLEESVATGTHDIISDPEEWREAG